ncbi:MAG: ATP-binding protein [Candidatus Moraniibacteriota bacterium]|nr:MAG: ATP-binding protein [Candidatus Moranbacteria bacterium]
MIKRFFSPLEPLLCPNKVLVLYGPRRVGKTTLLKELLEKTSLKYRFDSGENLRVQELFASGDFEKMKEYVGDNELIAIDEAQQIPSIGMGLKIIVDQIPRIKIIVTGSSSFELFNQIGEPLVGRKNTLTLYPFAQVELKNEFNIFDLKERLEEFLIYGSYPDVFLAPSKQEKIIFLNDIVDSYLLKDILALDGVKKSRVLVDLVTLLALQIGSEVSLNELAQQLNANVRTIEKYLDILEKGFVITSLSTLKRNLRNEVRGKRKYYFLDLGVRNALLSQFNEIALRNDVGALWENFLFIERLKKCSYQKIFANRYFWRTYNQKEIDLVEERGGEFFAYEFKWSMDKKQPPKEFIEEYTQSHFENITREKYWDFIAGENEDKEGV